MLGKVLKGIGGFYYVLTPDGEEYTLHAQSKIRRERLKPLTGDDVEFEPGQEGEEGWLTRILPRKNSLVRPPVANLDLVAVTLAASKPEADLLLADRMIISARMTGIRSILVINKCDENSENAQRIRAEYIHSGTEAFCVSALSKEGLCALRKALHGTIHAFAGQSGAGKSSLINALYGTVHDTGSISQRIERGKHTTRQCSLIPVNGGGAVVDTPGFSLLENELIEPETMPELYPEFDAYAIRCRFDGCMHINEPDCAVKEAVINGQIPRSRYERYALLYTEMKERWSKRYD